MADTKTLPVDTENMNLGLQQTPSEELKRRMEKARKERAAQGRQQFRARSAPEPKADIQSLATLMAAGNGDVERGLKNALGRGATKKTLNRLWAAVATRLSQVSGVKQNEVAGLWLEFYQVQEESPPPSLERYARGESLLEEHENSEAAELDEEDLVNGQRYFKDYFASGHQTLGSITEVRQAVIGLAWKAIQKANSRLVITSSSQRSIWQPTRKEFEDEHIPSEDQTSPNVELGELEKQKKGLKANREETGILFRKLIREGYKNNLTFTCIWKLESHVEGASVDLERWKTVLKQVVNLLPPNASLFDGHFLPVQRKIEDGSLKRTAHDVIYLEQGPNIWGLVLLNTQHSEEPNVPKKVTDKPMSPASSGGQAGAHHRDNQPPARFGTQTDAGLVVTHGAAGMILKQHCDAFRREATKLWDTATLRDHEFEGQLYDFELPTLESKESNIVRRMAVFGLPSFARTSKEIGVPSAFLHDFRTPNPIGSLDLRKHNYIPTDWTKEYKRNNANLDDTFFDYNIWRWIVARDFMSRVHNGRELRLIMPTDALLALHKAEVAEKRGFAGRAYDRRQTAKERLEDLLHFSKMGVLKIRLSTPTLDKEIFPNRVSMEILHGTAPSAIASSTASIAPRPEEKQIQPLLALEKQDRFVLPAPQTTRRDVHKTCRIVQMMEFVESAVETFDAYWKSTSLIKDEQAIIRIEQTIEQLENVLRP